MRTWFGSRTWLSAASLSSLSAIASIVAVVASMVLLAGCAAGDEPDGPGDAGLADGAGFPGLSIEAGAPSGGDGGAVPPDAHAGSPFYAIGVSVTGLVGSAMVLRNEGADDLVVNGNGSYFFSKPVSAGAAYAVTVYKQPSQPSQTCTVATPNGNADANKLLAVTCSTVTFSIGGTVVGLPPALDGGVPLVLEDNGGDDLPITVSGTFVFSTKIASGAAYAVTVKTQPVDTTCTVSGGKGTTVNADVKSVVVNCTTKTYTVGGTLTGLAGDSVVLQNEGGDSLTLTSNGTFAFPTPVPAGTPYVVTVATQPYSPSQTCTVVDGTGTVGGNVTSVAVSCTKNKFSVSAYVSGLAGNGLVLRLNGGSDLPIAANGTFTFTPPLDSGTYYAVTALSQPVGQTCTLYSATGTLSTSNVSVDVYCTTATYTIGGTVSGLVGTGLALQNNAGDDLYVYGNGTFTFSTAIASGGAYAVTVRTQPTGPAQTCSVTAGTGTVAGANVTSVQIACTPLRAICGTVSGLAGTVVLEMNGANDLSVTANGAFKFAGATAFLTDGTAYAVTVKTQPTTPAQTCTVSGGTGTAAGADVTNVAVTCATNTYTIGGTVTGLTGTGLVLESAAGEDLTLGAAGAFTFPTAIASGATYGVSVKKHPTQPAQVCTVTGGHGTVGAANVTGVQVACVAGYAVGGTVTGLTQAGLVLQDNGGADLAVDANGPFTFATPATAGAAYAVTVKTQPPGNQCVVTAGSGTIGGAHVSNVQVTCTFVANCNVLVLGSDATAADQAFVTALNAANAPATIVAGGVSTFTGTPSPKGFGAVVVMVGNDYTSDMPAAGQQALVDASGAGVGLVFSEWASYMATESYWSTLKSLLLFSRTTGNTSSLTFAIDAAYTAHPLWQGLPASFTTTSQLGSSGGTLTNGGIELASCAACGGPGVAFKDGASRIVHMAFALDYGSATDIWTNDANTAKLVTNAARWATHCN